MKPPVTVVISTRNRGETAVRTIQTILQNNYPYFELIVIDQSEDDLTGKSIQPFLGNPRFRYIRSMTRGLSAGRNVGIKHSKSELIALTDDDCETPADWLRKLVMAFEVDDRIGVVFGNVESGPYDGTAGFIPTHFQPRPFLAHGIEEKHRVEGMSACMGIRRSLWERLGGFDEMLGSGSIFRAGEETDFTIRAILKGHSVYGTPEVTVIHQGFRSWIEGRALIEGYLYGTGATFAKQLKLGHWSVISMLLHLGWRWALRPPSVGFCNRTFRGLRLKAFVKGFLDGLMNPVDRSKGHFSSSKLFRTQKG